MSWFATAAATSVNTTDTSISTGHDVPWIQVAGEAKERHKEAARKGECTYDRVLSGASDSLTLLRRADIDEKYFVDFGKAQVSVLLLKTHDLTLSHALQPKMDDSTAGRCFVLLIHQSVKPTTLNGDSSLSCQSKEALSRIIKRRWTSATTRRTKPFTASHPGAHRSCFVFVLIFR